MTSLDVSATGMHAQQLMIDVISNNIANTNTTAFKKMMAEFTDLPYMDKAKINVPPNSTEEETSIPTVFQVGLGVEVSATNRINTQGGLLETNRELDVAIQGKGYFTLANENGDIAYSRDGVFSTNAEGMLINSSGYFLSPEIIIPENSTKVLITKDGKIESLIADDIDPVILGQIELAIFSNENGLRSLGANLFTESNTSGPPILLSPSESNAGNLFQGYLESSNADPITLMTELLRAQRGYEMCSKAFQVSADVFKQIHNIQT